MSDYPDVYPYSAAEAKRVGELEQWRESHREDIACKNAIEEAIRRGFDGMYLKSSCVEPVLEKYGYKRVAWVLANTLQEKADDGRFSHGNKAWAARVYIPADKENNYTFAVASHPAVLDGFVNQYRQAYAALALFDHTQCEENTHDLDFEGKVLVLSPDILKQQYWTPQNQLWLALDGFGCRPHAIGRSIRAVCLSDGEATRWNRHDFVGVLKDEFLPGWAREGLAQHAPRQENKGQQMRP